MKVSASPPWLALAPLAALIGLLELLDPGELEELQAGTRPCYTCEGSGSPRQVFKVAEYGGGLEPLPLELCPDCYGAGWVPKDKPRPRPRVGWKFPLDRASIGARRTNEARRRSTT